MTRTGQDISREADTIDLLLLNAESHAVNARQRAAKLESSMYRLADDKAAKPEHIVEAVKRHRLANELVEAAEAMSAAAEELRQSVTRRDKIGTIYRLGGALLDAFERFESATRALDNS